MPNADVGSLAALSTNLPFRPFGSQSVAGRENWWMVRIQRADQLATAMPTESAANAESGRMSWRGVAALGNRTFLMCPARADAEFKCG